MSHSTICSINKQAGLEGFEGTKYLYLYLIVWGAAYGVRKKHWLQNEADRKRHAGEVCLAVGLLHTECPRVLNPIRFSPFALVKIFHVMKLKYLALKTVPSSYKGWYQPDRKPKKNKH